MILADAERKVHEEDKKKLRAELLTKLEPLAVSVEYSTMDITATVSAAISLKRIADLLQEQRLEK